MKIKDATIGVLQTLTMQDVREGSVKNRIRPDLIEQINRALEPAPHVIFKELFDSGVRLNSRPPNGSVSKTGLGGIDVISTVGQELEEAAIKTIVREYGIVNAQVVLRELITIDDLVDILAKTRVYVPSFDVVTKVDMIEKDRISAVKEMCINKKIIEVAAPLGKGIKELKEQIYISLDFISIFMKPQGEKADLKEPMVVRKGTTIEAICQQLHRDFKRKFRYSQVWGPSAKFPGQTVGLKHNVKDQDIVSIITHR
jgi:hypothetical protein